nr:TonB family protein [Sphingomonas populi]
MLVPLVLLMPIAIEAPAKAPVWKNSEIAISHAPMAVLSKTNGGTISFLLRISNAGKVDDCTVTESSGAQTLDDASCQVLKRYAVFEPARDASGGTIPGMFRTATSYQREPRTGSGTMMALTVLLARVPDSYQGPARAEVLFDATGHATDCSIVKSSGNVAIDRVACDQIRQQITISPPKTDSEQPATGLRWVETRFAASPS